MFGEDVARKGGVYGVTKGLHGAFGAGRVFDSLLDEQSILGLALGAGLAGLLPVPEIQYLAYLHNAADQLRGEAATLSFFSQGQYRNPMVLRIAGLAYQKGFGGHFHNDNAVGALRDIPGLIIACPARPDDAAGAAADLPGQRRARTAASASSLSRSRSTTSATCTQPATAAGWPATTRPGCGRSATPRSARASVYGEGHGPADRHVRQRRADEPAGRGEAGGRRHRLPRARPALAGAAAGR